MCGEGGGRSHSNTGVTHQVVPWVLLTSPFDLMSTKPVEQLDVSPGSVRDESSSLKLEIKRYPYPFISALMGRLQDPPSTESQQSLLRKLPIQLPRPPIFCSTVA